MKNEIEGYRRSFEHFPLVDIVYDLCISNLYWTDFQISEFNHENSSPNLVNIPV